MRPWPLALLAWPLICAPAQGAVCAAAREPGAALVKTGDGGAALFQSDGDPSGAGDGLVRRALGVHADGQVQAGRTLWSAGEILTGDAGAKPPRAPRPAPAARQLYTAGTDGKGLVTIPFEWAGLSARQRALLDLAPGTPVSDGLGEARLGYVRGERGREIGQPGGIFRPRTSVLGNAPRAPLYIGAPSTAVRDGAYAAFYERHKGRREAVYLGADDGMLHAFDAANGIELFAYIPDLLMGGLTQLADARYAGGAAVDAAPGAGEAIAAGGWRSVLVSGLGAGAEGVFALDVSDPARFASGGALWEFGQRDDPGLGRVTAAPEIARFRAASNQDAPAYRHFAVLPGSAGALFLLALDKPPAQPWQLNVNYFKLKLPAGEPGMANALGPPALVVDADGAVRYAYAGDLQGNLWRFDFSGPAPWANGVGFGAGKLPLFVARDKDGGRQPIAQRPQVGYAPGGGYLILFGTGKPEQEGGAPVQPQSFYAVRDALSGKPAPVGGRDALAARSVSGGANGAVVTIKGAEFRYDGAAAKDGWYLDFPAAEASLGGATLAGGKVWFNTTVAAGDPCAAPAARTYALDSLSGLATDGEGVARSGKTSGYFSAGGVRGAPQLWALGAQTSPSDATRRVLATTSYRVLNLVADGVRTVPGAGGKLTLSAPAGRMSWREVVNWRELHDAAGKPDK